MGIAKKEKKNDALVEYNMGILDYNRQDTILQIITELSYRCGLFNGEKDRKLLISFWSGLHNLYQELRPHMKTEKQTNYDEKIKEIQKTCMLQDTNKINLRNDLWNLQEALMGERFKLGFSAPTRKKEKTGDERMANALSIKLPPKE